MKPVRTNKYSAIGVFLVGVTLLFKNLLTLPEFFSGLGLGMGIAFELVGLFACCQGQNRLKNAKLSLLRMFAGGSNQ
jgi:hypothetical protein